MVETQGLEPWTPCLQSRCSSQLSYVPAYSFTPENLCSLDDTVSWVRHMFSLIARTSELTPLLSFWSKAQKLRCFVVPPYNLRYSLRRISD